MPLLRLLLNRLWIVTGGIWMAAGWLLAAVIMALTIIGLPSSARFSTASVEPTHLVRGRTKVWSRRISPVAAPSGDGLLSEPKAVTQPRRREPLFVAPKLSSSGRHFRVAECEKRTFVLRAIRAEAATN